MKKIIQNIINGSYIIIFLITIPIYLYANGSINKKELSELMTSGNSGTQFFMTFHPCWQEVGDNNAIRIYVSSSVETEVTLEIPWFNYKEVKTTIPNDIIYFHLTPNLAQAYIKRDIQAPEPARVYKGRAIIITSEEPIICYGVTRFHQTSDGYLAIPASGLGTEYTVASFGDPDDIHDVLRQQWLTSYTSIVGVYDNTRVDFDFHGRGYINLELSYGNEVKVTQFTQYLNSGDVLLVPALGPLADITGSKIRANKPVAVISGSFCTYVPLHIPTCDYLIEQDLPMNTWGTTYHVAPIAGRKKNSFLSVFAKEANTTIYRDGIPWMMNNTEHKNQFTQVRVSNKDAMPRAFTISSDASKPISVTQYNTGWQDDFVHSDPFQMVLTPLEQYQKEVIFNTPGIDDAYGFDENWVNIIYKSAPNGTIPNDLEIGIVNNGEVEWRRINQVNNNPGYQLYPNNLGYKAKQLLLHWGDGVYRIRGNEPFAVYAYGNSNFDTYGFPASVSLADLEIHDTHPPLIYYSIDCYGNIPSKNIHNSVAFVKDTAYTGMGETISYLSLIYMVKEDSYNYEFEYDEFIAGESIRTNFRLTKINQMEPAQARLIFIDRKGNITDTIISHHTTRFSITSTFHNFDLMKAGDEPVTQQFQIKNLSTEYPAQIGKFFFKTSERTYSILDYTIDDADDLSNFKFDLSELRLNEAFAPNETRSFTVIFNPEKEGNYIDSIGVGDIWDCGFHYHSEIRASVGNPRITVSDVNFGDVLVNTVSEARTVSITNNGNIDLQITGYDGPDLSVFTTEGLQELQISQTNPWVVKAKETVEFIVRFTPTNTINYNSEIIFISDADTNHDTHKPNSILRGRGIQPGLIANSYDWQRKRANLERYDELDYINIEPYPNPDFVISLTNEGSAQVTISNVLISINSFGEAFLIEKDGEFVVLKDNLDVFIGKSVESGETLFVPVYFEPKNSGVHLLELSFLSNAPDSPRSILRGVGIYPEVYSEDIHFKDYYIGTEPEVLNVSYENIRLTIPNSQYLDELKIYSIDIIEGPLTFNKDEINSPLPDSKTFFLDISAIDFPITLYPEDAINGIITLPIIFQPGYAGDFSATIRTVSDAKEEAETIITGKAILDSLVFVGAELTTCIGRTVELQGLFINAGSKPVILSSIELSNNEFAVKQSLLNKFPITLQPGEQIPIELIYDAIEPNQNINALITIKTNSHFAHFSEINAEFIVKTINFPLTSISETYLTDTYDIKTRLEPGEIIDYVIKFGQYFETVEYANVKKLNIEIQYDRDFLAALLPDGNEISAIEVLIPDWTVENVQKSYTRNESTLITLSGDNLSEVSGKEIIRIQFKGYLPSSLISSEVFERVYTSVIKHHITALTDNNIEEICVSVTTQKNSSIEYESVCADELRVIKISPNEFYLSDITPNPLGTMGANINFSIGIPVYTELNIYNSAGELFKQVIAQNLQQGGYSIFLNSDELPSGKYYYELNAGHFREVKHFVVAK